MITYNDGSTVHNPNLERPRTDVRTTGNLAVLNAELFLALNGESSAAFEIRGTFVGTVVVEATDDGVNYVSIPFYSQLTESFATTATAPGAFDIPLISAFRALRVRCSAFTSGLISTFLNASIGNSMVYTKPIPTLLTFTATAVLSAAVSANIPVAGIGLFHYIGRIRISKYCGATLTAAAAPLIVTTTNINNTPSFDFKTLGAIGDSETMDINFGNPLKSSVSNTITNFSAPATAGCLWKITVFYYVGA